MQISRCEKVILAHWPTRHEPRSAEIILRTLDHEAKRVGLYAPTKLVNTDITGTGPQIVKVVHEFTPPGDLAAHHRTTCQCSPEQSRTRKVVSFLVVIVLQ